MSDLCANCGDSHLPIPCIQGLKQCEICNCVGHIWLFCPSGAKKREPNHHFWMLCHNCDAWHLPLPCPKDFQQCTKCHNWGHMDLFCPVAANPRWQLAEYFKNRFAAEETTGAKRQRTDDVGGGVPVISAENLRTIRFAAAQDVIDLMKRHNEQTVLKIMGNLVDTTPILPPIMGSSLHGMGNVGGANTGNNLSSDVLQSPFVGGFRPAAPAMVNQTDREPPTPASDGHMQAFNGNVPGVYNNMHDRFGRGDFATNGPPATSSPKIIDGAQPFTTNLEINAPIVPSQPDAEPKPAKKQRAAPKPRCDECKGKKRRCSHIIPDETPDFGGHLVAYHAPDGYEQANAAGNAVGHTERLVHLAPAIPWSAMPTFHQGKAEFVLPAHGDPTPKRVIYPDDGNATQQQLELPTHGNAAQLQWLEKNSVAKLGGRVLAGNAEMGMIADQGDETSTSLFIEQPESQVQMQSQYGAVDELEQHAAVAGPGEEVAAPKKRGRPAKKSV